MSTRITSRITPIRQHGEGVEPLRREMNRLRSEMDQYERSFATWRCGRSIREGHANARMHVIESQLARLKGCGPIETQDGCPLDLPGEPQPVVYPIAAYRT